MSDRELFEQIQAIFDEELYIETSGSGISFTASIANQEEAISRIVRLVNN